MKKTKPFQFSKAKWEEALKKPQGKKVDMFSVRVEEYCGHGVNLHIYDCKFCTKKEEPQPECSCDLCEIGRNIGQIPPKEKLCGLNHSHNYWNCCAACIHGEVKGEGASGHVKACKYYKEEPSKEKEFICPCCKEINTHGLRCPFREESPKEEPSQCDCNDYPVTQICRLHGPIKKESWRSELKEFIGRTLYDGTIVDVDFNELEAFIEKQIDLVKAKAHKDIMTIRKNESGWISGYKAGIDEGYGMMENAVKEAKREERERVIKVLDDAFGKTESDYSLVYLKKTQWSKLKKEILEEDI